MLRVVHADAWALDDGNFSSGSRFGDEESVAQQIMVVQSPVNLHRPAKQAGAVGFASEIFHWFKRAQQNGGRVAGAFGHDVHAMMDAVDQINIGKTRRAKHGLGALRQPFG